VGVGSGAQADSAHTTTIVKEKMAFLIFTIL